MNASDLYQAIIVDHAKSPRGCTIPSEVDATARGSNPLCGDRVDVGVRLRGDVIDDVGATAKACALCIAAGSIMTEMVRGNDADSVRSLAARFAADIAPDATETGEAQLGDLAAFRGIRKFPSRKQCALLPWDTLLDAMSRVQGGPTR